MKYEGGIKQHTIENNAIPTRIGQIWIFCRAKKNYWQIQLNYRYLLKPVAVKSVFKESRKIKERQNNKEALLATAIQVAFEIPKNTYGGKS